jgi:hypothetical protein
MVEGAERLGVSREDQQYAAAVFGFETGPS